MVVNVIMEWSLSLHTRLLQAVISDPEPGGPPAKRQPKQNAKYRVPGASSGPTSADQNAGQPPGPLGGSAPAASGAGAQAPDPGPPAQTDAESSLLALYQKALQMGSEEQEEELQRLGAGLPGAAVAGQRCGAWQYWLSFCAILG